MNTLQVMQAKPEELEWPGKTRGLVVDLALVQHGLARMGGPPEGLLFSSEEDCALTPLLMLLLLTVSEPKDV